MQRVARQLQCKYAAAAASCARAHKIDLANVVGISICQAYITLVTVRAQRLCAIVRDALTSLCCAGTWNLWKFAANEEYIKFGQ